MLPCDPSLGAVGGGRPGPGNLPRDEPRQEWAVSKKVAHPELVSERDFVAVQAVRVSRPAKGERVREYLCTGLLVCRTCGRRMDALAAWFPDSGPLDILRRLRRDDLVVLCDSGEWELVRAEDAEGPTQSDFVESLGSGLHPFMG